MKNIIAKLLVFASLTIFLLSCSKDQDPAPVTPLIVGKWTQIKSVVTIPGSPTMTEPYTGNEPGCNKDFVEFVSGGVLNNIEYSKVNNLCVPTTDVAIWAQTGNNLKITAGSDVTNYNIEALTATDLVLKGTESNGSITATFVLYFSRI